MLGSASGFGSTPLKFTCLEFLGKTGQNFELESSAVSLIKPRRCGAYFYFAFVCQHLEHVTDISSYAELVNVLRTYVVGIDAEGHAVRVLSLHA